MAGATRFLVWGRGQITRHPFRTAILLFVGQAIVGGGLYAIFEEGNWYDGIYWAQVVMTTVGFGDFSPETFPGRCVFTMTVFVGVIATLIFTGAIAAEIMDAKSDHDHEDTEVLTDDVDHAIVQAQEVLECLQELRKQAIKYDERYIVGTNGNSAQDSGSPAGADRR